MWFAPRPLLGRSKRQWTGWVAITWEPQQTHTQKWKSCVFYVVRAETFARQKPAHEWTGWVAITWEPQQTHTQQWKSCVFCAWSVPRGYKSQRSSHVGAGSNTSTVALRVVKRSLDIDTEEYGRESQGTRSREWLFITVRQLRVCCCGALSLTRGQVWPSPAHLVVSPRWVLYSKIDWPTGRRS
jgi:hypothetical protein